MARSRRSGITAAFLAAAITGSALTTAGLATAAEATPTPDGQHRQVDTAEHDDGPADISPAMARSS